jgi:hypothetical protein
MIACPLPDLILFMSSLTGAAFTLFVVNIPAIRASCSEKIRARSFRPGFLMAAAAAENRYPFGSVPLALFIDESSFHKRYPYSNT